MANYCIHIRRGGIWTDRLPISRYQEGSWVPTRIHIRSGDSWVPVTPTPKMYITADNKLLCTADGKVYLLG